MKCLGLLFIQGHSFSILVPSAQNNNPSTTFKPTEFGNDPKHLGQLLLLILLQKQLYL